MNYRIGLDIGIGSVGWAVISSKCENHDVRIEDFGTRIFDSGENEKNKDTLCSERRSFRGVRRLERRRTYRKILLKNHFDNIGFLNATFEDDAVKCKDEDVYQLKVKGVSKKLTPAELFKCLAHTCNHRGYRDFYEPDPDDKEAGILLSAANDFEKRFKQGNYKTISEFLLAEYKSDAYVKYRNRKGENNFYNTLIRRNLLEDEARLILKKQGEYYNELSDKNSETALKIIFNQRDFEDGPGDPNDPTRRYMGFLETLGTCPFYKDEKRGFRSTVIADVYAVTNTLSQYRFINTETGEAELHREVAKELIGHLLSHASLTMTNVRSILQRNHYSLLKGEKSDDKALSKSIKYLPLAKKLY